MEFSVSRMEGGAGGENGSDTARGNRWMKTDLCRSFRGIDGNNDFLFAKAPQVNERLFFGLCVEREELSVAGQGGDFIPQAREPAHEVQQ